MHLDETVLNSDRITPEKDQRSNAINIVYIYIYTGSLRTSHVSVTSGLQGVDFYFDFGI